MKDIHQLIERFEDVSNAAVPEEMIGAYLEGNLGFVEMENVCNIAKEDSIIASIIHETPSDIINSIEICDNNESFAMILNNSQNEDVYNELESFSEPISDNSVFIDYQNMVINDENFSSDNIIDESTYESLDLPENPFLCIF